MMPSSKDRDPLSTSRIRDGSGSLRVKKYLTLTTIAQLNSEYPSQSGHAQLTNISSLNIRYLVCTKANYARIAWYLRNRRTIFLLRYTARRQRAKNTERTHFCALKERKR